MTYRVSPAFALPLVIALGTGTAVLAQDATTGTETSAGATGTPLDWDTTMNEAFLSDTTAGTLRGDAEITANWSSLTPEQRARVLQHCDTVTDGALVPDTLSTGDTGTNDPATAAPVVRPEGALGTDGTTGTDGTAATDGAATMGDTTATGSLSVEQASANMSQICKLVTDL